MADSARAYVPDHVHSSSRELRLAPTDHGLKIGYVTIEAPEQYGLYPSEPDTRKPGHEGYAIAAWHQLHCLYFSLPDYWITKVWLIGLDGLYATLYIMYCKTHPSNLLTDRRTSGQPGRQLILT